MYGGIWYGDLTYGGTTFTSFGLFNPTSGLDSCFDMALGYAGAWYAGIVYAGTPFCIELFDLVSPNQPASNLRNLCINRC